MTTKLYAPARQATPSSIRPRPRDASPRQPRLKVWASVLLLLVAIVFASGAYVYSRVVPEWNKESAYEAKLPRPALALIVQALKTFHMRNGRFPADLNELDEKVWKGERRQTISPDGRTLTARSANYFYAYHRGDAAKAVLWAVPLGERRDEAATHVWFITPRAEEKWMGPALLPQNFGATNSVPSAEQLRFLQMTLQRPELQPGVKSKSRGILSLFD